MSRDPYDRLESAAEAVVARAADARNRVSYEQGNRLGLLWVHALVSFLAGVQMLAYGSAVQIETLVGPHVRLVMGPLGIAGGLLLAGGLHRRPRSIELEAAGLSLVALWDLAMAVGLGYARLAQRSYQPLAMGQPQPPGYVSAYPFTVYAGLFALVVIHLLTLRRLRRRQRDGGSRG